MRIPVVDLPQPVLQRLQAIQANPAACDCFYKKEAGRGAAIFGLVVVAISVLLLLPFALAEELFLPMAIIAGVLLGAISWYSISRIRRFGRAPLRPMMILNPLYLVRVNLDYLSYHSLWSELTDLKITHHYTNGAYTNTIFEFKFKKGQKENISVAPKKVAEQLAEVIEAYRQRMLQALDNQDFDELVAHDLFLELRDQEKSEQPSRVTPAVGRRHLLAWAGGGAAGAVAGFMLAAVSYASAQSRQVEYCHEVEHCEAYFDEWAVPLYTTRAQAKLTEAYKQRWERGRKSAKALRQMAKLQEARYLTPVQAKEVLALYREGSQRELRALYEQAIEKYRSVSAGANPAARASLLKMLELARDKGYYRVQVTYRGVTDKVQTIPPSKATGFRPVVPMGPSFTDALNRSREALITDRIQRAFATIIPQDILEFPNTAATGSGSGYGSRYVSYRNRRPGLQPAAPAAPAVVEAPELELKVGYVVFPSGAIYVSKRDPTKLYVGIGFDWMVRIQVKEQSLYNMHQQSFPPPRFTVTSYGSRYGLASLGDGQVYATMSSTAFDDFSRNIVAHFGIPTADRQPAPRVPLPSTVGGPGLGAPAPGAPAGALPRRRTTL